jgi:predicted transcriptional regulator
VDTVLTIRISAATQRKLDRLARARRMSRSEIVRQALDQLEVPARPTEEASVYARIADLVGSVSSGHGDLSTQTGKRFTALLRTRRRR